MMAEFKEFALKGSLMDMAVGIIVGAAVSDTVGALVDSVLMPIIGIFLGGVDFSGLAITVGDANIGYGMFIQALINFLIIAFVIFIIVKMINNMKKRFEKEQVEEPAEDPADIALLKEIRDQLAAR
ncbi:MAG: large conductance mechanosensitive channel protein MscL [Gammaproteobacteria bacterium]|nr:MAG: large conductance mechanosensitive channel protein MscL [Gammaproteobacteria bacterium]